ncbi:MAG: sialidase family protein, partial [Planctomycetota bacterium]|nr:sialidase family protein [Planctomycetota bacterium]
MSSFASPIDTHSSGDLPPVSRGYSIPVIDLNAVEDVITVDRQKGQYLGHPTAVLMEDDKTILCVYPKGHGKGGIVYKKSTDGGVTWSERLATPENWKSSLEVPTIHRVMDKNGTERLIMWSGLYPARLAVSEDAGDTWSDLNPVGDWGGIVVMGALARLSDGTHAAWFHDDGR